MELDTTLYNYVLKSPRTHNFNRLADFLVKDSQNEKETVEKIYYWICQNIGYDYALSRKFKSSTEQLSVKNILKNKKTICSGYSNLFKSFCDYAKIECVIISGKSKQFGGKIAKHAWNAVNIHNKWYLIDNTWGAGYLTKGGNFERQLEMEYLFTNPNDFIIEHFPNDSTFQLLEKPITNNDFESSSFEILREKKFKDILD